MRPLINHVDLGPPVNPGIHINLLFKSIGGHPSFSVYLSLKGQLAALLRALSSAAFEFEHTSGALHDTPDHVYQRTYICRHGNHTRIHDVGDEDAVLHAGSLYCAVRVRAPFA